MAYTLIAKIKKFTSEKNNIQVWLNDSLATKPQILQKFKIVFLKYFSNNNSINHLANVFTTIKQRETEAILNRFIYELCSSFFQNICPMHPQTLQDAVTNVRNFELTELKANYVQAVNLVINGLSNLDSKLKQLSNSINQKLEGYLADNHAIYQSP
ncbi:hypothetical protein G9A89_001686 [Geosiphon pyriformis]|nr:hypothetical protein G9A89_001686 [Geosiphon pyriformis]